MFAGRLEPIPSFYGMHVAAFACPGFDANAAADAAVRVGVKVHSLERYYLGPDRQPGLIFGYGTADEAAIEEGLKRLSKL
jgi:GntR family transcriptional regulator/MocR family aminotransferase